MIEKEVYSSPLQRLVASHTRFAYKYKSDRFQLEKADFGEKEAASVLSCPSFLERNRLVQRRHAFMDESSFQLGDCIRVFAQSEAVVLLVTRIWAADSDFLPHVFVNGEVL